MSIPHRAVDTPAEDEYRRELRRARLQSKYLAATHTHCGCPICFANALTRLELQTRPPCPTCRGVGGNCPDCHGTGWTPPRW